MKAARRLAELPAYLFNDLEWKAATMAASGVDVIPLGFGDPDQPTPALVVDRARAALLDPSTHRYSNNRGETEFRVAITDHYRHRFGVQVDPDSMVLPALGAKESIFHLSLAFLDPGDVVLVPDPAYQLYTAGPLLVGARPQLLPLRADNGYVPDLGSVPASVCNAAKILFLNYPNSPTGAVAPRGFFEEVVSFADRNGLLVVHDNCYSEITYDGYVAPSFLATPGALDLGVEVISLSKTYNMTGWRCAALVGHPRSLETYRRLKTFVDSGMFRVVQFAGAEALGPELLEHVRTTVATYQRRRDLVCDMLNGAGFDVTPPQGTVYVWVPVPDGARSSHEFCERVLSEAAVALSPGAAYGPHGEGYFRMSLTVGDDRLLTAMQRLGGVMAATRVTVREV